MPASSQERRRRSAFVICRLGEGAAHSGTRAEKRADVPSTARAAGPVADDRWLVTLSGVCVRRDLRELGPDWLEFDVWLARSLLRYAARNRSIENTVPRDSM